MPIYEYKCIKCGIFEVEQKITEQKLTICPKCSTKDLEKIISINTFSLKGKNWAKDNYGLKSKGKGN